MGLHLEAEQRQLSKRLRRWIYIAIGCVLYLIADWSVLTSTQRGGYLFSSLVPYVPQSLAVLEYHESDDGNYVNIIDQQNYFTSRNLATPETIVIYQNRYAPFWAPTKATHPRTRYANHRNTELPTDLIEQTTEAASLISLDEAERLNNLLLSSNLPTERLWLGRVRNTVALFILLAIAISGLLITGILARMRRIKRALELSRCTCGYDLTGLTTPTCPECNRTIIAQPAQSPSTMDT